MIRKIYLTSLTLVVLTTAVALYGQYAVYRYPEITIDPEPHPLSQNNNFSGSILAQGAYLKFDDKNLFRAFQPQVDIRIEALEPTQIQVENIHPQAILEAQGIELESLTESRDLLLRTVQIPALEPGNSLHLTWRFPVKSSYRFVAIGDTGGDRELEWNLLRAQQLDADFILHAGDAYYDTDEIGLTGSRLNQSPVPVYTANGNHDFQGPAGNAIGAFLQDIGPMNARFSLLGHCFINLDTGAFMYPPEKGERASLLATAIINQNIGSRQCTDTIVFTHKPVLDKFEAEFPQRDHSLYGHDAASLIAQLQQLNNVTLIAGHIHNNFEFEQDGIKTYVSGSGLAHRDLLSGKQLSKLLIGEISADSGLKTKWAPNAMPIEYHCSKRLYRGFLEAGSPQAALMEANCLKPKPDGSD